MGLYIFGSVLAVAVIVVMIFLRWRKEKFIKKKLEGKKYMRVDDPRAIREGRLKIYRIDPILQAYGMSMHESGIVIEGRVYSGDKNGVKKDHIRSEIIIRSTLTGPVIGQPYSLGSEKDDGFIVPFGTKKLQGFPHHLAKVFQASEKQEIRYKR